MLGSAKGLSGTPLLKETVVSGALRMGMVAAVLRVFLKEPPIRRWRLLIPGGPGKREDERVAAAEKTLIFQASGPHYICEDGWGRSWKVPG